MGLTLRSKVPLFWLSQLGVPRKGVLQVCVETLPKSLADPGSTQLEGRIHEVQVRLKKNTEILATAHHGGDSLEFELSQVNHLQKQTKSSFGGTEQNPESLKHVIYNIQDRIQNYWTYEEIEKHDLYSREKTINGENQWRWPRCWNKQT